MLRRVVVLILAVFVVGAVGLYGCNAMITRAFGSKEAPASLRSDLEAHQAVLEREGDRLLSENEAASTTPGSLPTCWPPGEVLATADAEPELRIALEDLGVTDRFVDTCTAVFLIGGAAGFGADNPKALLYRGTSLYDPGQSCDGLMGATSMSAPLAENWYEGFTYKC
jgi:hypothetical protein